MGELYHNCKLIKANNQPEVEFYDCLGEGAK